MSAKLIGQMCFQSSFEMLSQLLVTCTEFVVNVMYMITNFIPILLCVLPKLLSIVLPFFSHDRTCAAFYVMRGYVIFTTSSHVLIAEVQ